MIIFWAIQDKTSYMEAKGTTYLMGGQVMILSYTLNIGGLPIILFV